MKTRRHSFLRRIASGAVASALLASTPAAAVPSPNYIPQRAWLSAIINLPALAGFFPIDRIERLAPLVFRVTAGRCHVEVRMVVGRDNGLSPPRYEPRLGRRDCAR